LEYLKPGEAAELLKVSVHTLKQWIYQEKIRSIKTPGGHHRIPRAEIERLVGGQGIVGPTSGQTSMRGKQEMRRALVIEDNLDSRDLLANLLPTWGFEATAAITAVEALRLAQSGDFDLYIIDTWLPDGNGIDLCRRIRESDSVTPIVFYSALKADENKKAALEAGAHDYVLKPHFEQLKMAVSRAFESKPVK